MPDEGTDIRIKQEIVLREEDDGAFLFDPDTGRICYLNEMGVNIWKSCGEPKTQEELIGEISLEFPDVPKDHIEKDCQQFFEDLESLGFLTTEPEE